MSHPTIKTLRRLRTLEQFNDSQLEELARQLTVETAVKKTRLISRGETEEFSLYLLSGKVKTIAKDNTEKTIESAASGDLTPLAHIRPSMYDVEAASNIEYIKIPANLLIGIAQQMEDGGINMDVVTIEQTDEQSQLTIHLFQEITSGNINLPSLPDVAHHIQHAFSQPHINADAVAEIIQADPAISAKLIMVANSALYSGTAQISTLKDAIVRIGLDATRIQVVIYVVKELFKSKLTEIKSKMQRLWKHSRRVAAFSRVLARQTRVASQEQAQLAGLIHDLGEIAILQFAQENPELYENDDKLDLAIHNLRPQITSMLLHKWNFTDELITVGEESENWFRNPRDEAELCDLVLIAQYHSLIGTEEMKQLPPIDKLPAFAKLGLSTDNPGEIMSFMKESKAEVDVIEGLLGRI